MGHEPPSCGLCTHRVYLMSCDEYDTFVADYEDRCAICRRAGHETGHGFLCIDHDPFIGQWAVRGLLCSSCNGRLSMSPGWRPEAITYLADPWYLRWFAALGLSIDPSPEPPVGSTAYAGGHRWRRTRRGWECQGRNGPRSPHAWDQIHKRYGPDRARLRAAS